MMNNWDIQCRSYFDYIMHNQRKYSMIFLESIFVNKITVKGKKTVHKGWFISFNFFPVKFTSLSDPYVIWGNYIVITCFHLEGILPYDWSTECLRGDAFAPGNATAFPQAIGLGASFRWSSYQIIQLTLQRTKAFWKAYPFFDK